MGKKNLSAKKMRYASIGQGCEATVGFRTPYDAETP